MQVEKQKQIAIEMSIGAEVSALADLQTWTKSWKSAKFSKKYKRMEIKEYKSMKMEKESKKI